MTSELDILTTEFDRLQIVETFVEASNHGAVRHYTDEGLTIMTENDFVINEVFCE